MLEAAVMDVTNDYKNSINCSIQFDYVILLLLILDFTTIYTKIAGPRGSRDPAYTRIIEHTYQNLQIMAGLL